MSLSVAFSFICQKSSHRFLPNFFLSYYGLFSLDLQDKKWGSPCSFKRKGVQFYLAIELSLREISYVFYARALMCAR